MASKVTNGLSPNLPPTSFGVRINPSILVITAYPMAILSGMIQEVSVAIPMINAEIKPIQKPT